MPIPSKGKKISLHELPENFNPSGGKINWGRFSPNARRHIKKQMQDLRKEKIKENKKNLLKLNNNLIYTSNVALSTQASLQEERLAHSITSTENENKHAQVSVLQKIITELKLENAKKDQEIEQLQTRIKKCTCTQKDQPGWQVTFNSNRRLKK